MSWPRSIPVICLVVFLIVAQFAAVGTTLAKDTNSHSSVVENTASTNSEQLHHQEEKRTNNSTEITPKWQLNIGDTTDIVADSNSLYIATRNDGIQKVDLSTGDRQWSSASSGVISQLKIQSDYLVGVHTSSGSVGYSRTTGKRVWAGYSEIESVFDAAFVGGSNGTVFVAGETGYPDYNDTLSAVNTETGDSRWELSDISHSTKLVGADKSGLLIYEVGAGRLYKLGRENQSVIWELRYPLFSSYRGDGTLESGTAYVWNDQGQFIAFNATTGDEKWSNRSSVNQDYNVHSQPAITEGSIYVPFYNLETNELRLQAFNASTGEHKWTRTFANASDPPKLGTLGSNLFVDDRVLSRVTGEVKATLPGEYAATVPGGIVLLNDSLSFVTAESLPTKGDFENTSAAITVGDRFPTPQQSLVVNATNSTGTNKLDYTWYLNGSKKSCTAATCEFEVSYPVNITLEVTDTTGSSDRNSTVVRSSQVELEEGGDRLLTESETETTPTVGYDSGAIGHSITAVQWSVIDGGEMIDTPKRNTTAIRVSGESSITVRLSLTLTDPLTGHQTTRIVNETVDVERLHSELPHFTFDFGGNLQDKYSFAVGQNRFDNDYRRLSQRVSRPPDTVSVSILSVQELEAQGCPADAAGCAEPPNNVYINTGLTSYWDSVGPDGRTMRHELTHLIQYQMDASTDGEWNFIAEGHASFEETPIFFEEEILEEKPSIRDLKNFEFASEEYTEAALFVAGFYAKYGRQKFLTLIRNSENEDLESEFKEVTGDSFRAFYESWAPTSAAEGPNDIRMYDAENDDPDINIKPMFVYRNRMLYSLKSDSIERITWDVDGDGKFEKTGPNVSWTPDSTGEYAVTLRYQNGNQTLSQTQVITVQEASNIPLDVTGNGDPATDVDGDGLYEDLNGNGKFDIGDIQALYAYRDSDTVQNNISQFDFNRNGQIDIGDVQALFTELRAS